MTETHILLVRHGQTGWNEGAGQVRYRGQTDIPLDEVGHAQARALAARLAGEPIASIYASPLQRALQTARPTAERRWLQAPHTVTLPGGENLAAVLARSQAVVTELVACHAGQTVMLVGHQVVNKVLICWLLGLDNAHYWRVAQDNACLNVFTHADGVFNVMALNDTCHLR